MATNVTGTHTSRRINAIAAGIDAKTYLEIGVYKGDTFMAVDIPQKEAVDPNFRFDYQSHASESVRFHAMPSDDYFVSRNENKPFDIVFLDGLHTFEQTFRDFCNTLSSTHGGSVILLDDTIPSDVYSAYPNQQTAVRLRNQAGGAGNAWHGDVYKMIFAIHDFFPTLSYLTIGTMGNPQTLVWRESRKEFRPRFDSLEAISRMSWFDYKQNMDLARLVPEPEALEQVSAGVHAGAV